MSAIGIDLGTSKSCVAVWRRGGVEVISNEEGARTTPSYVSFNDSQRFVGAPAASQLTRNRKNTVFDVKRLIGRNFNDPVVQEDKKRWPFTVVDVEGKPRIQVEYMKETKLFAPEEISAMVLRKMKEVAEKFLGEDVKDAVITVPASFNNAQRQATIDAGKIAGLNVLRIINEPTAAALAYGLDTNPEGDRNVLIYDLGGGTFDVSIVTIEQSKFTVRASRGDPHLGGGDFDHKLVNHILANVQEKCPNLDANKNVKEMQKLRILSEEVKRKLSALPEAQVEIDDNDCNTRCVNISQNTLNTLCSDLFHDTIEHVKAALVDAGMTKEEIHDVVLVGGSTRIPKVRGLLQEFLGKTLTSGVNPEEVVACGAAIQAAMLIGLMEQQFQVADHNLEGKSLSFQQLGPATFLLSINDAQRNVFDLKCNENGIMTLRDITPTLSSDDVRRMIADAAKYRANDEEERVRLEKLNQFERFVRSMKQGTDDVKSDLNEEKKEKIRSYCDSELEWLENNTLETACDFDRRLGMFQERCVREGTVYRYNGDSLVVVNCEVSEARRRLQEFAYNLICSSDDVFKTSGQREKVVGSCQEALAWIDENQDASKESLDETLLELQDSCERTLQEGLLGEEKDGDVEASEEDEDNIQEGEEVLETSV